MPEKLKPEVDRQIEEMLRNDIIRPSQSPMASPLVCVLKGKEGCDGVRLAIDYRYVNRFTRDDAYILPDVSSIFQHVGNVPDVITCAMFQSKFFWVTIRPMQNGIIFLLIFEWAMLTTAVLLRCCIRLPLSVMLLAAASLHSATVQLHNPLKCSYEAFSQ